MCLADYLNIWRGLKYTRAENPIAPNSSIRAIQDLTGPSPIPSYYDNWVLRQSRGEDRAGAQMLARHRSRREQGRFVDWDVRRSVALDGLDPQRRNEIPDDVLIMSQGAGAVMQWRGANLYKSVFDYALLPMLLAELRPAAILEIGSGTGASAIWLADVAAMQQIRCMVVSVDIAPVAAGHPGVRSVRADARDLAATLPDDWSEEGPKLVLEDAHVCVAEFLDYVDMRLAPGDYLIVEDSVRKYGVIAAFLEKRPRRYVVDTHYTDFFGRNATSCIDSIFKRTP